MRRAFGRAFNSKLALPPVDVTAGLIVVLTLWLSTLYEAIKFLVK